MKELQFSVLQNKVEAGRIAFLIVNAVSKKSVVCHFPL